MASPTLREKNSLRSTTRMRAWGEQRRSKVAKALPAKAPPITTTSNSSGQGVAVVWGISSFITARFYRTRAPSAQRSWHAPCFRSLSMASYTPSRAFERLGDLPLGKARTASHSASQSAATAKFPPGRRPRRGFVALASEADETLVAMAEEPLARLENGHSSGVRLAEEVSTGVDAPEAPVVDRAIYKSYFELLEEKYPDLRSAKRPARPSPEPAAPRPRRGWLARLLGGTEVAATSTLERVSPTTSPSPVGPPMASPPSASSPPTSQPPVDPPTANPSMASSPMASPFPASLPEASPPLASPLPASLPEASPPLASPFPAARLGQTPNGWLKHHFEQTPPSRRDRTRRSSPPPT